jgi:fructokinase
MIYTLGESLLDIIISSMDNTVVRPGGAMLNTSVSLGRSNLEVSLITELGDDNTSKLILDFLSKNKVEIDYITKYERNNTSLALAFLDENKKPSYTFIKNYPANRNFSKIPEFTGNDILLFGSIYSLDSEIRKSILSMATKASQNNATIIYDPNIRNAHHLNDGKIRDAVFENISLSNIIKGSDEDFTNIFGFSDPEMHLKEIRKINNNAAIIITLGPKGVIADLGSKRIQYPAVRTNVVSTIGAGDAFNAGLIYTLYSLKISTYNEMKDSLEIILENGLKFSSVVCSSLDNYINMPNSFKE